MTEFARETMIVSVATGFLNDLVVITEGSSFIPEVKFFADRSKTLIRSKHVYMSEDRVQYENDAEGRDVFPGRERTSADLLFHSSVISVVVRAGFVLNISPEEGREEKTMPAGDMSRSLITDARRERGRKGSCWNHVVGSSEQVIAAFKVRGNFSESVAP